MKAENTLILTTIAMMAQASPIGNYSGFNNYSLELFGSEPTRVVTQEKFVTVTEHITKTVATMTITLHHAAPVAEMPTIISNLDDEQDEQDTGDDYEEEEEEDDGEDVEERDEDDDDDDDDMCEIEDEDEDEGTDCGDKYDEDDEDEDEDEDEDQGDDDEEDPFITLQGKPIKTIPAPLTVRSLPETNVSSPPAITSSVPQLPNVSFTTRQSIDTVTFTQSYLKNETAPTVPATTLVAPPRTTTVETSSAAHSQQNTPTPLATSPIGPQPVPQLTDLPAPLPPIPTESSEPQPPVPSAAIPPPPPPPALESAAPATGPRTQSLNPNAVSNKQIDALVFSPYRADQTCKDEAEMRQAVYDLSERAVRSLRIYSTDCNVMKYLYPELKELGVKIDQGFWMGAEGTGMMDHQVDEMINYGAQYGWDQFSMVLVSNEAIFAGYTTPGELVNKIGEIKGRLRTAGYNGPVSTAEPPVIYAQHPELCLNNHVDFVGINSHPYFNPSIDASQAGQFVATDIQQTEQLCGKRAYVTETGYPWQGDANGLNVPSRENQKTAIKSIIDATNGDITILTMYDEAWKVPGPYNIERYFGVVDIV